MSLYKQLWLAIFLLMLFAFGGSFWVSNLSAKDYLQEQLQLKNLDNVNALALSISNDANSDVAAQLLIAAQFDSGHYQYIRLHDPDGNLLVERVDDSEINDAPAWFIRLLPIDIQPAQSQISNGWQQLGTLTLASHTDFAYNELWHSSQRLLLYFAAVALLAGTLGSLLLRLITRPLISTVAHAEAIGDRRFISSDEPYTLEFRAVIRAMNKLSARVKNMLREESAKLDQWRKETQTDKTTGLLNREPLLAKLHSLLQDKELSDNGSVILVRLLHLAELNRSQGRKTMDALLAVFGKTLNQLCVENSETVTGRLNGSDFIVICPQDAESAQLGQKLQNLFLSHIREQGLEQAIVLPTATTRYRVGESVSGLLSRIDCALADSEQNDGRCTTIASSDDRSRQPNYDWQAELHNALQEERFTLAQFPVYDSNDQILHMEAPVRLQQVDGNLIPAGQFMPQISQYGLGSALDLIVTELALQQLHNTDTPIGINLSTQMLSEPDAMLALVRLIEHHADQASKLWLEVPEFGVYRQLSGFRTLCRLIKPLGCRLGIEHVGPEVGHIGELHDLGLDYVKIDRSLIHKINSNTANQVFLRGLCSIVHSIGLLAIAEGVESEDEWSVLKDLGLDAGTGKYFS